MKKLLIASALIVSVAVGCETKKSSTTTSMEDSLNSGREPMSAGGDTLSAVVQEPINDAAITAFVQKTLSGGMMEIELGNIASGSGGNQRVKDFGSMMVADHSQAGDELKQLAAANSISVPAAMLPEHQAHVDMIKNKTGAAFDKAYMDMMVKDHEKDVAAFKKASAELTVPAYKSYALKTLPVLEKHLDSARAIHKNL